MDALYEGPNGQAWKDSRIKIYGWADPSYNASTSKNSNIPLAYNIVPNSLQLSQTDPHLRADARHRPEDHIDWGFRFTNLYGIDYRYTTAKGYFSNQLLKHNHLYGYDPLQMYVDFYFPHFGDGTVMRIGRYISPLDIEAQLSPENFLYTHSIMFAYDPYTFTGVQFTTRINDHYTIIYGVHAGNDMAPWTTSSQPNGEILLRWVAQEQQGLALRRRRLDRQGLLQGRPRRPPGLRLHLEPQVQRQVHDHDRAVFHLAAERPAGGTVPTARPQPYFEGTGPGTLLPGLSTSYGIVNYTSYVIDDKSLLVFRSDCLADFQGQRTGHPRRLLRAHARLRPTPHLLGDPPPRSPVRLHLGPEGVRQRHQARPVHLRRWT